MMMMQQQDIDVDGQRCFDARDGSSNLNSHRHRQQQLLQTAIASASISGSSKEAGRVEFEAAQQGNCSSTAITAGGRYGSGGAAAAASHGSGGGSSDQIMAAAAAAQAMASMEQLKCPRCDSRNTKFCYYNNYSLSQPRHFCKNCRRYWTEGGALRNVPVGGGCRKNKRTSSSAGMGTGTGGSNSKLQMRSTTVEEPNQSTTSILSDLGSKLLMPTSYNQSVATKTAGLGSGSSAGAQLLFNDLHHGFPDLIHNRPSDLNINANVNVADASALKQLLLQQPLMDPRFSSAADLTPSAAAYVDQLCQFLEPPASAAAAHIRMTGLANSATATLASIEDQLTSFSSIQPFTDSNMINHHHQQQQQLIGSSPADRETQHGFPVAIEEETISSMQSQQESVDDGSRATTPSPPAAAHVQQPQPLSKELGSCCFDRQTKASSHDQSWVVAQSRRQQEHEINEDREASSSSIHYINNMLFHDETRRQHTNNSATNSSWNASSRWPDCVRSTVAR